ncbi:AraC family transcriptional regulator [Pseudomonas sp. v388]|uniref:AraC family transcriptional regulator n=1 Tax=Pseudomonas sp. v388 TaxID=2479849 RepID=UPI00211391D7|nr:AraC family transcriptional regulator [Pseudomonas sp. v388]
MHPTVTAPDESLDPQFLVQLHNLQNTLLHSHPATAYQKCVALGVQLLALCPPERNPAQRVALAPWQERRAKELMMNSITRPLSISQVAQGCSLSRSHFSRAFKKNTGYSPQDWFLHAKIERSKQLLESGMPITQVSLECGFADQSHFTRTFTRKTGQSPMAWRRAQIRD